MAHTFAVRGLRILAVIVLALAMAGCSSPYKLVVHNETDQPIVVRVEWLDGAPNDKKQRSEQYELAPSESKRGLVWIGQAPDQFTVKLQSDQRLEKTFARSEYPLAMQGSTSKGPTCHLRIAPEGWTLSGPTVWDKLEASPLQRGALACCGLPMLAAFIVLLRWLLRRPEVSRPKA